MINPYNTTKRIGRRRRRLLHLLLLMFARRTPFWRFVSKHRQLLQILLIFYTTLFLFALSMAFFNAIAKNGPQTQNLQNNADIDHHPPHPRHHPRAKKADIWKMRQDKIKQIMQFAWSGYEQHAWGKNELKPSSKTAHLGPFGVHIGVSIVDSLDTLWTMGLRTEFERARQWVQAGFDFGRVSGQISVFEANIRLLGGLLSAHALTNDKMFLQKARQVGDVLLKAFDTETGIPLAAINPADSSGGSSSGGCSVLSELGTLELEMVYLSRLTGDAKYAEKAARAREVVIGIPRGEDKLYPNFVNSASGTWCEGHAVSLGAMGDSFYEYLLKIWIFNGSRQNDPMLETYQEAVEALERHLLFKSKNGSLWYFGEMKGDTVLHQMGHLACFSGGMFALQAMHATNDTARAHYAELAAQIGHTCHESYIRTATKLGPELFGISDEAELYAMTPYYILRPEAIEAWFYLWRLTKNPKYREWCWEAAQAIEQYCRAEAGYAGLRDVNQPNSQDDVQQSFFLAETLKYLYLVFGPDDHYSLDKWVFNTEAHPFPIGDGITK